MANDLNKQDDRLQGTEALLHSLRDLIQGARQKAMRAVDAVHVQTCWEIGRQIEEFEQADRPVPATALVLCLSWLNLSWPRIRTGFRRF